MKINFWDCKYSDYEEGQEVDDEDWERYICDHPKGDGNCPYNNKGYDATAECKLAEVENYLEEMKL